MEKEGEGRRGEAGRTLSLEDTEDLVARHKAGLGMLCESRR